MTYPALKITSPPEPPAGSGWRDVGSPGWQYAWMHQLVQDGIWARLKGSQLAVLGVLLAHANTDGRAWPQPQKLERLAGQAERSVQMAVKALEEMGLIQRRPADDAVGRPYIQFIRCSGWAAGEHVMAAASAVPARPESPKRAQLVAPKAHAAAPQAQPSAPEAQRVAPRLYRKRTEEIEISSSSESPAPNGHGSQQAGLFDDDALISLLESRGFVRRRAAALLGQYEPERILQAVTHCDFLQAKGEIRKSYQGALTGFLARDFAPDARIAKEAQAQARRERDRQAAAASMPTVATGRPVTGDARTVVAREGRLRISQPSATQAQLREAARLSLGWSDERWQNAIKDL